MQQDKKLQTEMLTTMFVTIDQVIQVVSVFESDKCLVSLLQWPLHFGEHDIVVSGLKKQTHVEQFFLIVSCRS